MARTVGMKIEQPKVAPKPEVVKPKTTTRKKKVAE